jgi:hypothetical protein
MSSGYIPEALRRSVISRAQGLCEYCLIHEEDTFFGCEIDHIISEKHGGPTEGANLAYACFVCNHRKGSDIASILWPQSSLVRFYNPRTDRWSEHFRLRGARIEPLTQVGEVTARIFGFNDAERILEREALMRARRYPSRAALARMTGSSSPPA